MKPLTYFDLVIEVVRGRSPVPEVAAPQVSRLALADAHIKELKARFGEKSGNEYLDFVMENGAQLLCYLWEQMSPPALTMCGDKNINLLREALETVHRENIPGDFIETGVWRGGLPVIMRAFLEHKNIRDRRVFVADSFKGLPDGSTDPNDQAAHIILEPLAHLSASRTQVEEAFKFFGLLDEQVVMLEGWFKDTLPTLPSSQLAIARLDGDYYESTRDALIHLYPKLSKGGYLIVDDYNLPLGCQRAVDEFRAEHRITAPLIEINTQSVYWRKE